MLIVTNNFMNRPESFILRHSDYFFDDIVLVATFDSLVELD